MFVFNLFYQEISASSRHLIIYLLSNRQRTLVMLTLVNLLFSQKSEDKGALLEVMHNSEADTVLLYTLNKHKE